MPAILATSKNSMARITKFWSELSNLSNVPKFVAKINANVILISTKEGIELGGSVEVLGADICEWRVLHVPYHQNKFQFYHYLAICAQFIEYKPAPCNNYLSARDYADHEVAKFCDSILNGWDEYIELLASNIQQLNLTNSIIKNVEAKKPSLEQLINKASATAYYQKLMKRWVEEVGNDNSLEDFLSHLDNSEESTPPSPSSSPTTSNLTGDDKDNLLLDL